MPELTQVAQLAAGELALRLNALRGTATYAAYLVDMVVISTAVAELEEELTALVPDATIARLAPGDGERLVAELSNTSVEVVVVETGRFSDADWAIVDRQRSSIAHRGVVVFVVAPTSFASLMRSAPNLASWLGGEVFAYSRDESTVARDREQRLVALRAWAAKTDDEIVAAARAGTLPRDPEYAEWLVLLGRGDLIDAGT